MSPEQASGERNIDGRTDIFALGCVLYELAAGEAAFKGPTPQATLMRRFTGPPRKLRPMVNVPESLEAAIFRAVARDPTERFASAAEFAAALAGDAPAAPPKPPPALPSSGPAAAPGGTAVAAERKGCFGIVVLLLSAGAVAGALLLT